MTQRRVIYPLGRTADLRPRLHGTFAANGLFHVCRPDRSTVSLLADGGVMFHVAGATWSSRLWTLPGFGVAARGVGQNVVTSIGRGMLTLRFEAAAGSPVAHGILDVSLGLRAAVCPISSASAVELAEAPQRTDGRASRFSAIDNVHDAVARLRIVRDDVLRRLLEIADGVRTFSVPTGFEPLEEQFRLAAHRRRPLHHTRDCASRARNESTPIGAIWAMDWTRQFPPSLQHRNRYAMVRVRFSPDKSSASVISHLKWLRKFIARERNGLMLREVRGDSDTSWTVPNRGVDMNTAKVNEYLASLQRPFEIVCVPPNTHSLNFAERGQKKLLMLLNLNLHAGRLSLLAWQDMLTAAEGQLDFYPLPDADAA